MQKRIKTTESIKKVCKAMRNLAVTRLAKSEHGALRFRPFASNLEPVQKSDIDFSDQVKKVLIVPVASNKGLCGGINSNVRKYVQNMINEQLIPKKLDFSFFFIGARLSRFFNEYNTNGRYLGAVGRLDDVSPLPFQTTLDLVDRFFDEKMKFDQMKLVYNFYVSKQKYIIKTKDFYSKKIALKNSQHLQHYESDNMGDQDEVNRDNLYHFAMASQIHQTIVESHSSEQASRMLVMDNAMKSCDDIIKEMKILFNVERQKSITTELTEIVTGVQALSRQAQGQ